MEDIRIEKIIRSKRKTIALQVTDNATLIIRAPYDIDEETLLKVMLKHEKWIRKKIEEMKK